MNVGDLGKIVVLPLALVFAVPPSVVAQTEKPEAKPAAKAEASKKAAKKATKQDAKGQADAKAKPTPKRKAAKKKPTLSKEEAERKYQEGVALEKKRDEKGALTAYLAAGEAGHGLAQKRLGEIYEKGNSATKRDYDTSLRWYDKARKQGVEIQKPIILKGGH